MLKAETKLPIVPVIPRGSKISRIEASTMQLEAGNVLLPEDPNAPAWLTPFMRELLTIPNAKHDDQADALARGLSKVARRGGVRVMMLDGRNGDVLVDSAESSVFDEVNEARVLQGLAPNERAFPAAEYDVFSRGIY